MNSIKYIEEVVNVVNIYICKSNWERRDREIENDVTQRLKIKS